MILPWCVLAVLFAATYARMTRNSLLETLGEDYIRTARAKGLTERDVIIRHGLRASLAPIVTMLGMDIALLVGGAIITESVFNIQGLGWLAIDSTLNQDLPTVLGVVMVATVAVVLMNLMATSPTPSWIRECGTREETVLEVRDLNVVFPTHDETPGPCPISPMRCTAGETLGIVGESGPGRASPAWRSWASSTVNARGSAERRCSAAATCRALPGSAMRTPARTSR